MDLNLSQSSCEIITEIKNLEVCSETENFSDQFSDITKKVDELNVELESSNESSSASESESLNDTSSSSSEVDAPVKRKRKRKRKRRKKTTVAAYSPPEPFTARYKRIKMMQPVLPKLHIRFDELGIPDVETSEYTMKPRIVKCLTKNLLTHENIRDCKTSSPTENSIIKDFCIPHEELVVSLKPRIIKAIIIS